MCTTNELNLILKEISKAYREVYRIFDLVSIILYGSYARGDYQKDSDIDIVAIVKETGKAAKGIEKSMGYILLNMNQNTEQSFHQL